MPAPRGVPQIEVTFDIDANGILSVNAKDKGTGKEQSITITGASTLPKEEVERLVEEAEKNSDLDKQKREQVDLKNQADSLCYQSENQLKDLDSKIEDQDRDKAKKLIDSLRKSVELENYEQIKKDQNELQQVMMDIGKKVYSSDSANSSESQEVKDSVIDTQSKETG